MVQRERQAETARVGITLEEDADPGATTENNVLGGDLRS